MNNLVPNDINNLQHLLRSISEDISLCLKSKDIMRNVQMKNYTCCIPPVTNKKQLTPRCKQGVVRVE